MAIDAEPRWDYAQTEAALTEIRAHIQAAITTLSDFVVWEKNADLNHLFVAVHLRPALTHLLQARDEVNRS